VSTLPDSLVSYRQLLEDAARHDLGLGRARPRNAARLAVAVAAAAALALGLTSVFSRTASAQSILRHAAAAVAATPGTILHIDMTATQNNGDGTTVSWHEESWQLESAPYSRRQIETANGSTVESGNDAAGEEIYDAANNTIYVYPRSAQTPAQLNEPHVVRGSKPGTFILRAGKASLVISAEQAQGLKKGTLDVAWRFDPHEAQATPKLSLIPATKVYHAPKSADDSDSSPDPDSPAFRNQILALLNSGDAHVVGHKTIDGRDTIQIDSADGHTSYYVDPDTYDPVELDTRGTTGGVNLRFNTYETLSAAGNGDLIQVTAQHPNATVDRSASDYDATEKRLFPHG
jgi:hypothetical protein